MVGSLRIHAGASRRAAFGSRNPYHIGNPMPRENRTAPITDCDPYLPEATPAPVGLQPGRFSPVAALFN